ncbi:MAG: DUF1566 domain-containing protein [Candidatus Scalindua sp. AMX11]|nr:MAG: DUF1566 domain-containing protein [Candidatus Scalindua sp.]NOG85568.1 DUF1566 domain-containing protein [Planctomycetota bacterium]RZV90183.1 MAG: DUF1566 domain-containing protein [Candidatus Scalindua sp. SCAELEC01]TDE64965.1 MAG: DUF1566 domain-containing protein [Candidatus Scalindua sp. AMX11]GJQ59598.1 MAG: hypothetical protein SCALA701_23990 [Candidatus Scalindua sp.]
MEKKLTRFLMIAVGLLLLFGLSSTVTVARAAEPAMTSPVPGSDLTTATVMFEWDAGTEEDLYRLHVGTTGPGSKDIVRKNELATTSFRVTGIPLTGDTVYVRLWWRVGGAWKRTDYDYPTRSCTDAYEPNNSRSRSYGPLTSGRNYKALICSDTDVDWYKINVGSTGVVDLSLRPPKDPCLDYEIELYSNAARVAGSYNGSCGNERITYSASPGIYFIKVYGYSRAFHQSTKYRLSGTWSPAPEITNPAPGSLLTTTTVSFEWDVGTVEDLYRLHIGTTGRGSKNFLTKNEITTTSYVVTGIPLTGETVYVRLWWRNGDTWYNSDYTYRTQSGGNQAPIADDDTVTTVVDVPVTIDVIAGDSDPDGTVDPATVFIISDPINGTAFANSDGTVDYVPYAGYLGIDAFRYTVDDNLGATSNEATVTVTVDPADTPTMKSPVPDSTLTTASVSFEWNAGTEEDLYRLHVGTTGPGSKDILKKNELETTTYVVHGIPVNGNTIYVRLWWRISNTWDFADYVYQAPPPSPVAKTGQTSTFPLNPSPSGSDGDLKKGVAWPSRRFKDNGDATVTDNLTGIIWTKAADLFGQQDWLTALASCNELVGDGSLTEGPNDGSIAGQWRLANLNELLSLIDRSMFGPALPSGHPFTNVPVSSYWTSTTIANDTTSAWAVGFDTGFLFDDLKGSANDVWCIRD